MKTPPEPILSCYLAVLQQALVYGRAFALEGRPHQQIADLLDAVHVIPELLTEWERCDERGLFRFLEEYDRKYAIAENDFSLTKVFQSSYGNRTYPPPPQ